MHEIVTVQLGQRANYVATHYWNTQVFEAFESSIFPLLFVVAMLMATSYNFASDFDTCLVVCVRVSQLACFTTFASASWYAAYSILTVNPGSLSYFSSGPSVAG